MLKELNNSTKIRKKYFSKDKTLEAIIYMSMGSREKPKFTNEYGKFMSLLNTRKYKGLNVKNDTVIGTHMSCMAQAFINGFHFINGNTL